MQVVQVDKKMKKCKNFAGTSNDDEMVWFTYETTQGEAHNFFTVAGNSGRNLVSPSVQLTYNELTELKNKYGVWMPDPTDVRIGTVAGRTGLDRGPAQFRAPHMRQHMDWRVRRCRACPSSR